MNVHIILPLTKREYDVLLHALDEISNYFPDDEEVETAAMRKKREGAKALHDKLAKWPALQGK